MHKLFVNINGDFYPCEKLNENIKDTVINALCFQRKKTCYPLSGEYSIVKHYVIYNSLYVDTLSGFLETMKKNLNNRYGYETDQIFISNYALNYPASKLGQVLTYLTCKTSALLARVNGLDIYNIYDCNSKKNSINKLISTLQEYAGISVI